MDTSEKTKGKIVNFFSKYGPVLFSEGEIVIDAQSEPSGVYYLEDGFVRQYNFTKSGNEITYHFYRPGSFFPLTWALAEIPNSYNFSALTKIQTRLVPKKDIIDFLQNNPDVLFNLTTRLLYGLTGLLTRVESLASDNANERVVSILFFLSRHFGKKDGDKIIIAHPFTHQELANLANLSRETTSRELETLVKKNSISLRDHCVVLEKDFKTAYGKV